MDSRRGLATLLFSAGLIGCGAIGVTAWAYGMWGLLTGAVLTATWLIVLTWWTAASPGSRVQPIGRATGAEDAMVLRVLLDSAPTPLLGVDAGAVRALNRAARTMFATDDRILPPPAAIVASDASHLRHEDRNWRIDRVTVAGVNRMVVALIDIEHEERIAEARASADLIHVLGHELLNGLAPIVSLAESGLAAAATPDTHRTLLPEILGTLARRAEGLRRFTEAYRALARLPEPKLRPTPIAEMIEDIARLFAARWPAAFLEVDVAGGLTVMLDRDQISQALWAIVQNAAEASASSEPSRVTIVARRDVGGSTIEVGDNGPGVSPDHAHRIFRPFHTTKPDGTGVGLSLARQIVHAHGGTLKLLPAMPTTFHLALPTKR